MQRRQFNATGAAALVTLLGANTLQLAHALDLSAFTDADASKGLKTALEKGALAAIGILGVQDGFLGNEKVRINLPPSLNDAANLMRRFGQGGQIDELITAMNRGAEAAVPLAKDLLVGAVQSMSVQDAKGILTGGDTSATNYFSSKTRPTLATKFLPVVAKATEKLGLAAKYNEFAGKAADMGLMKREDANIEQYVTGKALDGLFLMIGEEEKKIRQNPVGYGSSILTKVFGALR